MMRQTAAQATGRPLGRPFLLGTERDVMTASTTTDALPRRHQAFACAESAALRDAASDRFQAFHVGLKDHSPVGAFEGDANHNAFCLKHIHHQLVSHLLFYSVQIFDPGAARACPGRKPKGERA